MGLASAAIGASSLMMTGLIVSRRFSIFRGYGRVCLERIVAVFPIRNDVRSCVVWCAGACSASRASWILVFLFAAIVVPHNARDKPGR